MSRQEGTAEPASTPVDEAAPLEWTNSGPARSPAKTFTLVALVPLSAALGLVWTRQPLFALLGPAFLAPVLSRYFARPSYRLTDESARASWGTQQTEIRWPDVRRATFGEATIHLSPLTGDDLRQRFRGVELRLPDEADERGRIAARVRELLPEGVVYDGGDDGRDA